MTEAWQELRLRDVFKEFRSRGRGVQSVLEAVTLSIRRGEFFCIVGPSGSGKTTLLNIIAGFERPTTGGLFYDDSPVTAPGTDRAVIFQDVSNALFPWLTAVENVEYGAHMRRLPRPERRERAMSYLGLVGLAEDARKLPFELSGGMKQRVQIARALANNPDVLLMDEPFAGLDAINKGLLQEELIRIWESTAKTVVFITHDIAEAIRLGTRVAVLSRGPGARIRKEFVVDIPRPRAMSHPRFLELQQSIETIIRREVQRSGEV